MNVLNALTDEELLSQINSVLGSERQLVARLVYYQQALQCDPDDPWLHLACGSVLQQLGRPNDARVAIARSLELSCANQDDEVTEMATKVMAPLDE